MSSPNWAQPKTPKSMTCLYQVGNMKVLNLRFSGQRINGFGFLYVLDGAWVLCSMVLWFPVLLSYLSSQILTDHPRLDTTIAADVQGSILESLGEIEKLSWVGSGFPMGSVATILLLGYCYGLFQIKWVYLGSIILFEVGSAICGAAPTMDALIVGRVLAGIGGAGMYLG